MNFKLLKYLLSLYYWDYASLSSVKRMQLKKFRDLFNHAKKHSKFYREYYGDNGVLDLEINNWSDIQKVPLVNKALLRSYSTEEIITCKLSNDLNIHSTSGSTGEPFRIAFSKYEDYTAHVRLTKSLMRFGYNPFKKMLLLSRYEPGHKFEIEDDIRKINTLQKKIKLFRREVISIFEPIPFIIERIKKTNPYLVWLTPSVAQLIALEMEKRNNRLDIPILLLMAETITPEQIRFFRERVCKKIIDAYGCMESPSIGFSLNSIDYKNIVVNSTFTEVINQREINGNKVGDIVITNLINKTMPFIRYDLGDFAGVINDKKFPIKKIGPVYGRFDEILTFGNGHSFTFHQSYQLFNNLYECEQYKFIQTKNDDIILQLKVRPDADKRFVHQKVMNIWREKYPDYPLIIEWKDNFEIDKKTGKFKVIEKMKK